VGCGNGRYLNINNDNIFTVGVDTSPNLINLAKQKKFEVAVCNNLNLPFRTACLDVVLSIAVIHHLSTHQHRLQAIQQMTKILKPGGQLLVYVWAFEQEKHKFRQQDIFLPWKMKGKYVEGEEDKPEQKGVPENTKEEVVFQRYYHVFKESELQNLILESGDLQILQNYYEHNNWVVLAQKV